MSVHGKRSRYGQSEYSAKASRRRGSDGNTLLVLDMLTPLAGDIVVPKRYYSAFPQTDLDATCRVHHIDRLVVTGLHTGAAG